jgi:hypothetical protein
LGQFIQAVKRGKVEKGSTLIVSPWTTVQSLFWMRRALGDLVQRSFHQRTDEKGLTTLTVRHDDEAITRRSRSPRLFLCCPLGAVPFHCSAPILHAQFIITLITWLSIPVTVPYPGVPLPSLRIARMGDDSSSNEHSRGTRFSSVFSFGSRFFCFLCLQGLFDLLRLLGRMCVVKSSGTCGKFDGHDFGEVHDDLRPPR